MKIFLGLLMLLIHLNAFGAPCNGALGRYHVNPDGSQGGFIQRTAWVDKNTFLDSTSEICDKAIIRGRVQIEDGSRIRENVIIEGSAVIQDSHIHGSAKISGRVTVQNSEICQASLIEGIKVINTNYYCQTEDSQPKPPGEENFKTLLGVDSDGDGVRDDIEIFINNILSNTPTKNNSEERSASKIFAKVLQKEFLLRDHKEHLQILHKEKTDIINCFSLRYHEEIFLEKYDTIERIYALAKIAGAMHGEKVLPATKKCKSLDGFDNFITKLSKPGK